MSLEKRHKQFYARRQEPAPDTPIPVRRKRSEKKPTLRHLQQKLASEKKALANFDHRDFTNGTLGKLWKSIVEYHRRNVEKIEGMIAELEAKKSPSSETSPMRIDDKYPFTK